MDAESIIVLVVSVGLMVYLLYALLRNRRGSNCNDRKWLAADHRLSRRDPGGN